MMAKRDRFAVNSLLHYKHGQGLMALCGTQVERISYARRLACA
jgi:hypothetical protein